MKNNRSMFYWIGVCLFLVITAFFTTAFPLEEKYKHVSSLFVILFALPCYYGLVKSFGLAKTLALTALMSLFALVLENFAIATGLPYGSFAYGNLIGATIGKVPWTVGFAWTPILFGAYALAQKVTSDKSWWFQYGLAAMLMTALDVVLDPGSVGLGFWTWEYQVGFYGVPWSNFAGWLLSSFVGILLLGALSKALRLPDNFSDWSYSSFFLMLVYWTAVCLFLQLWGAVVVGALFLILLLYFLYHRSFSS